MSRTQTITLAQESINQSSTAVPDLPDAPSAHYQAIEEKRKLGERLAETVRRYWDLGFTSFGGPGVHVVILR